MWTISGATAALERVMWIISGSTVVLERVMCIISGPTSVQDRVMWVAERCEIIIWHKNCHKTISRYVVCKLGASTTLFYQVTCNHDQVT